MFFFLLFWEVCRFRALLHWLHFSEPKFAAYCKPNYFILQAYYPREEMIRDDSACRHYCNFMCKWRQPLYLYSGLERQTLQKNLKSNPTAGSAYSHGVTSPKDVFVKTSSSSEKRDQLH